MIINLIITFLYNMELLKFCEFQFLNDYGNHNDLTNLALYFALVGCSLADYPIYLSFLFISCVYNVTFGGNIVTQGLRKYALLFKNL